MKTTIVACCCILLVSCSSTVAPGDITTDSPGLDQVETVVPDLVILNDITPLDDADIETEVDVPIPEDAQPDEQGPQCAPGEGCFLDSCVDNSDCQSAWCIEHLGEKVCTQTCQEDCPSGWTCNHVEDGGPDLIFICVSAHPNLCRPCLDKSECAGIAGTEDACIHYGDQGSFCGGKCTDDGDCPWGFACSLVETVDGIPLQQCVAETGECPCTDTSVELGLWTPCRNTNESGSCLGKRVCSDEGLTDCNAPIPQVESCNGVDDDCDGETDEPALISGNYVNLCDDANDCTDDLCSGLEGCLNNVLEVGDCSDLNPCTVADHCEVGACVGDPVECEDDNPCTDNVCTETGGCEYPVNEAGCEDGNPCTVADHCEEGSCVGITIPCDCQQDDDCTGTLDDGNLCNGTLICDLENWPYKCIVDATTIISCPEPEGVDALCLSSFCNPASGDCSLIFANEGLPCLDNDACTINDQCVAGVCSAGTQLNCNDGNLCTDDSCAPDSGCLHEDNIVMCDDGNVCTIDDQCQAGQCEGGPALSCDDSNICNGVESCHMETGCVPGLPLVCDDQNACTPDTCDPATGCVYGVILDCDDGNACTVDTCNPLTGQCHSVYECICGICETCVCDDLTGTKECLSKCDDGNACTTDGCDQQTGICSYAPVVCGDDSICTDDTCDPLVGCITTLNDALCDDEDVCTLGDHCHLGDCLANLDLVCNDNNPCTTDNCNSIAGCQFIPNSESCDDGNACTEDDICAAGVCKAGISVICDDGKLCTTDTCSPDSGCLNIWNDVPCDDGSICTQQDQCSDGECIGGPTLVCDDGNVCTDDSCGAETGCVFALNSAICEDGNACTENDTCSGGWCAPGTPVICNDSNVCTDDSCDPKTGCTGSFNAESCNDANACTTNDICSGGSCTGGPPPSCDLGEPCREYGCDINTGCTSSLLDNCCGNGQLEGSEECDDGNLTPSDGCESDCKLPTIPTVSLNGYIWYLAEKGANCNVTCASVGKSCISLVQANYIESSCSANVAVCPNFFPGLPCVTDGDGPRVVYSGNTPTQCKYRNWNYGGMTCTYSAGGNTAHMCACQ